MALLLPTPSKGTATLQWALDEFETVLNDDQRSQLKTLNDQRDATAVLKFTTLLDEKNAARRSRCIAARVHTLLESVQRFSTVVETFVSSNPKIAALIWGSLKFTLLLASEWGSYFDKLSTLFMRFGRHCPRYDEYQVLYQDSTRLQSSLCSFYSVLVCCCTRAVQAIQRPGFLQFARSLLSSFESDFGVFEKELLHWSKEAKEEIKLASVKADEEERRKQSEERRRAHSHRDLGLWHWKGLDRRMKQMDDRDSEVELRRSLRQKRKLLARISDYDHTRSWKRARKECIGTTGQWLTKTKEFEIWKTDAASSLLLCTGKLGSGKTVLTASVIAELFQHVTNVSRTAYFFCQFDDVNSLNATKILSSLLKQVLCPETIAADHVSRLEAVLGHGRLEIGEIEELLKDAILKGNTQYVIIDAIDECADSERSSLLKSLKAIAKTAEGSVKLFLSSRDGNDRHSDLKTMIQARIQSLFEDGDLVVGDQNLLEEIKNQLIDKADGMFLWVTFQLSDICSRHSDHDIRVALQELPRGLVETYDRLLGRILKDGNRELVQKIFRWVAGARRPLSLEELQEAIAVEPYQECSEPDRYINDIMRIPLWCHGLASCDEEDGALQFAHSTIKAFLSDQYRDRAHSDFHINPIEADNQLGEACVTYLNFNDFKTQLIKRSAPQALDQTGSILEASIRAVAGPKASLAISKLTQLGKRGHCKRAGRETQLPWSTDFRNKISPVSNHPFFEYASANWLFHTRGLNKENIPLWTKWSVLVLNETEFLEDGIEGTHNIIRFIQDQQHHALLHWLDGSRRRFTCSEIKELTNSNMYIELTTFTRAILKAVGPEEQDAPRGFRLVAKEDDSKAFFEVILADASLIKAILKSDAKPHRDTLVDLFRQAADLGDVEAVQVFLDANVTMESKEIALRAAVEKGHIRVVDRLLAANADVNAPSAQHMGITALRAASEMGHSEIVDKLLAAGADANARASHRYLGRTALQAAAQSGHIEIVQRLLTAGADVNAPASRGEHGRTALQAAAESGHSEIVDKLLAVGADVNAPAAEFGGRTALQAAANSGHSSMVDKLLSVGADVNAPGAPRGGRTALQAAAEVRNREIVNRLRTAGATH